MRIGHGNVVESVGTSLDSLDLLYKQSLPSILQMARKRK